MNKPFSLLIFTVTLLSFQSVYAGEGKEPTEREERQHLLDQRVGRTEGFGVISLGNSGSHGFSISADNARDEGSSSSGSPSINFTPLEATNNNNNSSPSSGDEVVPETRINTWIPNPRNPEVPLQKSSTVQLYPFLSDDQAKFARYLDDAILFSEASKKARALGVLDGTLGAAITLGLIGYINHNTRDFFHFAYQSSGTAGTALWLGATLAPVLMWHLKEAGESLGSLFFREDPLTPTPKEDDGVPHVVRKLWGHRAWDAIAWGTTAVKAAIPALLVQSAYENEDAVFGGISACLVYQAWFQIYNSEARLNITRIFQEYKYDDPDTSSSRKHLREMIRCFKLALQKEDEVVLSAFKQIRAAQQKRERTRNQPGALQEGIEREQERLKDHRESRRKWEGDKVKAEEDIKNAREWLLSLGIDGELIRDAEGRDKAIRQLAQLKNVLGMAQEAAKRINRTRKLITQLRMTHVTLAGFQEEVNKVRHQFIQLKTELANIQKLGEETKILGAFAERCKLYVVRILQNSAHQLQQTIEQGASVEEQEIIPGFFNSCKDEIEKVVVQLSISPISPVAAQKEDERYKEVQIEEALKHLRILQDAADHLRQATEQIQKADQEITQALKFLRKTSNVVAFTALFFKTAERYGRAINPNNIEAQRMVRLWEEQELPMHRKAKFLTALNIAITGVGTVARYGVYQYCIEAALGLLGAEGGAATAASILATFETLDNLMRTTLLNSAVENSSQQTYFQRIINIFQAEHLTNMRTARRLGGAIAAINGILFALPNTVAGYQHVFSSFSRSTQVGILAPLLVMDFLEYDGRFNEMYNNFITAVMRIKESHIKVDDKGKFTLERKRAFLDRYADRMLNFLERADRDSIQTVRDIVELER